MTKEATIVLHIGFSLYDEGVKDAKGNQPRKHATDAKRISHDRRGILRTRKMAESIRLHGGAFARETKSRGVKGGQPDGCLVQAWAKGEASPRAALMPAWPIQK